MMLVQKQPNFPNPLGSVHHHHRRHPSAPVVVLPTRTPGLLSLSMPKPSQPRLPQQHQPQQQRPNRSPKSKPAGPHNHRSPRPAPADPQQVSEAESLKKAQHPTSSEKHVRGRQQANSSKPAVKDKITRSTSPSLTQSAQGRRNNARQPSPPIQTSTSQAEGPSFAHKSNLFDPFIVNSDSDSDNVSRPATTAPAAAKPVRPTPKLANPSGKLARRRQPPAAPGTPTPASSKAVPVPRPSNGGRQHTRSRSAMMNLSRSAPITSPLSSMGGAGAFPICDDTTDADGLTPPSTPTGNKGAMWQQRYDDGPRTAPLSSVSAFPFGSGGAGLPTLTPSPTSRRYRHHGRSPSEGVFNMSFDEDLSSSSDNASEELRMLFGLKSKPGQGQNLRSLVHASNSAHSSASKAAKAALYASSLFQNSPSPDELPPPAF